jgi:hypothetical protein
MARQERVNRGRSGKTGWRRAQPIVGKRWTGSFGSSAKVPDGPILAFWGGTVQAQATWLGDTGVQSAQRQALAAQFARVGGNRHLQRAVDALKRDGITTNYIPDGRQVMGMALGKTEPQPRREVTKGNQPGIIQCQKATASGPGKASKRSKQIFLWMEKPLQKAVKNPQKIKKWNDDAVAALVLIYNKMRNENVWQYVGEIKHTSPKVSVDFLPKGGQASLPSRLAKQAYSDCLAGWGIDWGVRKEKVSGAHLHFKHFQSGDSWVNVHIDTVNPCSGDIPIFSRIYNAIRHYIQDKKKWSKRKPKQLLKLLKKQGVPLSTGVLRFLRKKGYI